MEDALTNKEYELQRFPGKGGWTYASFPDIPKNKGAAFGLVRVKGTIDGYEIKDVTLMPGLGTGILILPIKAEIRKKIGKEEGDNVHIVLYPDNDPFVIRHDFKQRLLEHEGAYEAFVKYRQWEQKMCVNWIYAAKREETTEERIKKTIGRVFRREKLI